MVIVDEDDGHSPVPAVYRHSVVVSASDPFRREDCFTYDLAQLLKKWLKTNLTLI